MLPGYFAGAAWQRVAADASKVGLALLILMGFIVDHRVAWATGLMKVITWLGSNAVLTPLVVALGGYALLRKKDRRAAVPGTTS